jgi:hypothetical protein
LRVGGEALIEGDEHFVIYSRYITQWEDGSPIEAEERDSLLRAVVAAAQERGWHFVIQELSRDPAQDIDINGASGNLQASAQLMQIGAESSASIASQSSAAVLGSPDKSCLTRSTVAVSVE